MDLKNEKSSLIKMKIKMQVLIELAHQPDCHFYYVEDKPIELERIVGIHP